jgi:DNA-binding NarL/FixJ family response regulator
MASILLLQNDPVVGECLRRVLNAEPGLRITGLAATLAQARQHLERAGADLLVADLRIGDERLIELLRERRSLGLQGHPQVLVITMSPDDPRLMQALRHGAHGYFIHGSPIQALAGVIRQVLAGESPMSAPIARRLRAHFKRLHWKAGGSHAEAPFAPGLTEAEHQMLNRVSQGYLLHEIAREMQTSEHSVGLRTRSLYRKLALARRASAMLRQAA